MGVSWPLPSSQLGTLNAHFWLAIKCVWFDVFCVVYVVICAHLVSFASNHIVSIREPRKLALEESTVMSSVGQYLSLTVGKDSEEPST